MNIDHRDEAMLRLARRALQAPRRMMGAVALQRLAGLGRLGTAVAAKVTLPLPMSLVAGRRALRLPMSLVAGRRALRLPMSLVAGRRALLVAGNVGVGRKAEPRGACDVAKTRRLPQGSTSMKGVARVASDVGAGWRSPPGAVAAAYAGKGLLRALSGAVAASGEKERAVAPLAGSFRIVVAAGHAAQRWGAPGAKRVEQSRLERAGAQYARVNRAVASGVAVTAVAQSYASQAGLVRSVAPVGETAVARARELRPGAASTAMPARVGAEQGWDAQRWLGERMVRQASLPPAAANGFDTRMGPDWHGIGSFV